MALHRFYWLIEGRLAGCSRPGAASRGWSRWLRPGSVEAQRLCEDLGWLRGQGIGAVLTLTETSLPPESLTPHDLAVLHLPVPDMHAPTPDELMLALEFIDRQLGAGRPVAVHCLAGQGRTGTILAAYLIRGGVEASAAIDQLRAVCPGAIESAEQQEALADFAGRRDWVI